EAASIVTFTEECARSPGSKAITASKSAQWPEKLPAAPCVPVQEIACASLSTVQSGTAAAMAGERRMKAAARMAQRIMGGASLQKGHARAACAATHRPCARRDARARRRHEARRAQAPPRRVLHGRMRPRHLSPSSADEPPQRKYGADGSIRTARSECRAARPRRPPTRQAAWQAAPHKDRHG